MINDANTVKRAVVMADDADSLALAVTRGLRLDGWEFTTAQTHSGDVDGVVYLPGRLFCAADDRDADPAGELIDLLDRMRPRFGVRGARVVAVSTRDWLGWPDRPRSAAASAALIAAVRSLALAHGRAGITVNAVVSMRAVESDAPAPGTRLRDPRPLTGDPVDDEDVAAAVAFLLDPRSAYITGQVLQCCGGSSLLSSMSA